MAFDDNPGLMRKGLLVMLAATGLFAIVDLTWLVDLPEDARWTLALLTLLSQPAHILFVVCCALCWVATTVGLARFWAALSGGCMAVAWLLSLMLRFSGPDFPLVFQFVVLAEGLRWFALGFFGWFLLTRDDHGSHFGRARSGYSLTALPIFFGVVILVSGLGARGSLDLPLGSVASWQLVALLVLAIMIVVRLPVKERTR